MYIDVKENKGKCCHKCLKKVEPYNIKIVPETTKLTEDENLLNKILIDNLCYDCFCLSKIETDFLIEEWKNVIDSFNKS